MYFNIARILYLQVETFSVCSCCFRQLLPVRLRSADDADYQRFWSGSRSFPVPDNSWTTLVELMSIYKRLRSFDMSWMVTKFRK